MESTKLQNTILAPNPATVRGYACPLTMSKNGEYIGYCVRQTIIIRSTADFTKVKSFNGHTQNTTAVGISVDGKLAASGDEQGNIIIWNLNDLSEVKKLDKCHGGKITGIKFTEDNKFLFIYGEGKKTWVNTIEVSTARPSGDFEKNVRTILDGDITLKEPFKAICGGEDGLVNIYKGRPYSFEKSNKEHKNVFITCTKYSPDETKFASAGFDKKIIVYSTETGDVIDTIAQDKSEGNHQMSIIALVWLDNERLITASWDKTIKIWNITEKKCVFTLIPKEGKLDISEMFCNVVSNGKLIVAIALSGTIYVWNVETLADKKLPDQVIQGHQGRIVKILYVKETKEIISSDFNGRILLWPENGFPQIIYEHERLGETLALSNDSKILYIPLRNGEIIAMDKTTKEVKYTIKDIDSASISIIPSKTKTDDTLYLLCSNDIAIVTGGKVVNKKHFNYEAKCFAVNEADGEILIGDIRGKLHTLDMNFGEKSWIDMHVGEFSSMKLSPDGKHVASGDNMKYIWIWDVTTKKVVCDRFGFHSGKIFDICWNEDCDHLLSCSLDGRAILWKLATKTKVIEYQSVDRGQGLNSIEFIDHANMCFVTGGYACNIQKFMN